MQETNIGKRIRILTYFKRARVSRLTAWTAFNRFMNTQLLPLTATLQLQRAHENGRIIWLVCSHNGFIITRTIIIEYNSFLPPTDFLY